MYSNYLRTLILSSFLFVTLLYPSFQVQAQETFDHEPKRSFFTYSTGYSPHSIRLLGKTRKSKTFISKISYSKLIKEKEDVSIYFTVGLIPFLHYDYSKRDNLDKPDIAKGFGLSPWGFDLIKPVNRLVSYKLGTSGSIIYMNKFFPTDKSRRLNFAFDLSAVIQKQFSNRLSFSFGYKFHHISNAQTGKQNPGLDSNFIFISIHSN